MVLNSSRAGCSRCVMSIPALDGSGVFEFYAGGPERTAQGRKLRGVMPPLRHRGVVNRTPHLRCACGGGGRRIAMKFGAGILPVEAAELEQLARLVDLVGDQIFIIERIDGTRHDGTPVVHELPVGDVVPSDLIEIVGKRITI